MTILQKRPEKGTREGGNWQIILSAMTIDKVEALRRTALFSMVGESELKALADRSLVKHLSRGDALFFEGEEATGLYVIVQGAIRAYRESGE